MKLLTAFELLARKISVRLRLILAFTLILACMTGIMGIYATSVMSDKIQTTAEQKLQSGLALGKYIIDLNYPGEWKVNEGKLYKGDTLIEGNFTVVDKIGQLTGDNVTIFRGDTRVATNVMKDGKRAVGTQAAAEVIDQVIKNGKSFNGRAQVASVDNYAVYDPIAVNGKVIGMVFLGSPAAPYDSLVDKFRLSMIIYSIVGIVLGFIAAFLIAYTVYKPLKRMETAVQQLSAGDFREQIPKLSNDEPGKLAQLINTMIEHISALINKNKALTDNVKEASIQLARRCDISSGLMEDMTRKTIEMKQNASQQAQLSGDSRTAISEMSEAIKQVAENAEEVLTSALTASTKAREGESQVYQATDQMQVITRNVNSSAQLVEQLGQKSMEIGQIVDLITSIANQTNMLALNAAIEAARAGEQGKGFAVVAEEVRKLAEESGEAAQRIDGLIREIQEEADRAVEAMQEGTREVKTGSDVVMKAGRAFEEILLAISLVNEQIQQMSAASEEMAASAETAIFSIEQVSEKADGNAQAANQVSQLAEGQMAGIQEVNASVESLNAIVAELEEALSAFKI
ncbi:MAG TPA: methyl-accepting chemotaxis protein [Syntrophomonadaceae bacterium]|nr:methyl-accepting chemotaxis protein [Syntrophomonadaceae bacterium]